MAIKNHRHLSAREIRDYVDGIGGITEREYTEAEIEGCDLCEELMQNYRLPGRDPQLVDDDVDE